MVPDNFKQEVTVVQVRGEGGASKEGRGASKTREECKQMARGVQPRGKGNVSKGRGECKQETDKQGVRVVPRRCKQGAGVLPIKFKQGMTVVQVRSEDGASKERGDASKGREECKQGAREMQARGEGSDGKQRAFHELLDLRCHAATAANSIMLHERTDRAFHGIAKHRPTWEKSSGPRVQTCCLFLLTTKSYVCFACSDGAFLPLSALHYIQ